MTPCTCLLCLCEYLLRYSKTGNFFPLRDRAWHSCLWISQSHLFNDSFRFMTLWKWNLICSRLSVTKSWIGNSSPRDVRQRAAMSHKRINLAPPDKSPSWLAEKNVLLFKWPLFYFKGKNNAHGCYTGFLLPHHVWLICFWVGITFPDSAGYKINMWRVP